MGRKTHRWEVELWSYLSKGDGIHCPVYQSCRLRLQGIWCLSDHEEYYKARNELLDDDFDLDDPARIKFEFSRCSKSGRIFKLVSKLATKYRVEAGIDQLPVPVGLISRAYDNLPIEVRQVPLKVYHGAVWRLSDCWMVHLNSNDTPAIQRFTLYHEVFHILAHCKATPVFKKKSCSNEGTFNELLADHFAGSILVPEKWLKEMWIEVKDIHKMSAIFDVPKPVIYLGLKAMSLI
jgi:hypothetical protein